MKRIIKYILTRIKCLNCKVHAEAGAYIGLTSKIENAGGIITLGQKAKVRPQTHLYASEGAVIETGENTEIGRGSTISSVHLVQIGKGVLTGPRVYISDHNHEYRNITCPIYRQGVHCNSGDRIYVGNGSWLGTRYNRYIAE